MYASLIIDYSVRNDS